MVGPNLQYPRKKLDTTYETPQMVVWVYTQNYKTNVSYYSTFCLHKLFDYVISYIHGLENNLGPFQQAFEEYFYYLIMYLIMFVIEH